MDVKTQKNGNEQLNYWGRNGSKILNPYLTSIKQDCDIFKFEFDNMIRKYIYD